MSAKYQDINQQYYHDYYQFKGRSQWMEKIWSEAFADQYPEGLEHYGYLTLQDLGIIASRLDLAPGSRLLDIGCGKGGPGLKIAQDLQLKLTGVDVIPEAVEQAEVFKTAFDLVYPAHFEVGEFFSLPLEDASVDAVICIDSLWASTNKIQALAEANRVMKPGAKFIFTYWDLHTVEAIPLLEQSGLKFISREDTPNWKEYQQRVYAGIEKYKDELVAEMGEGANMLLYEATASPPYLDLSVRRIYQFDK